MKLPIPAILAVLMIVTSGTNAQNDKHSGLSMDDDATTQPAWNTLQEPRRTAFQRNDGSAFEEMIDAWARAGLRGAFGECSWSDIPSRTISDLVPRLMDRENAAHWIDYGWILIVHVEDDDHAEHAFKRALESDPNAQEAIDAARGDAASQRADRAETARLTEDARLSFITPEAKPWPTTPWPNIPPMEISRLDRAVRDQLQQIARVGALSPDIVETDRFLIAFDGLEVERVMNLADVLEDAYYRMDDLLRPPQTLDVFPAKVMVVVTNDRDRFLLLESQLYDHLPADNVHARCHCDGRLVSIIIEARPRETETWFEAARQVCFAYLHGYGSPVRLPAWANEGLATWIAVEMDQRSSLASSIRAESIDLTRTARKATEELLALSYGDTENFIKAERSVGGLGYLMIDLMEFRQRGSVRTFVQAVKSGREIRHAVRQSMGMSWNQLMAELFAHYRVNN